MKIDLRNNIQAETSYNLQLIRDGKVIQDVVAHNMILRKAYRYVWAVGSVTLDSGFYRMSLGSGTGTIADTDTSLFNYLWATSFTPNEEVITFDEALGTLTKTSTFTVPASATYVGTITELGWGSGTGNNYLATHALIYDAEGNPISVVKTDTDILIINAEVKFTFTAANGVYPMPINHYSAFYVSLDKFKNPLTLLSVGADSVANLANSSFTAQLETNLCFGTSAQEMLSRGTGHKGLYNDITGAVQPTHLLPMALAVPTKTYRNITWPKLRLGGNFDDNITVYANCLIIANAFVIPLPNSTYFPNYTLSGINIGVGDGTKVAFTNPLNYFVLDTDIVYKNGVALTRGVDYTIDNKNNHSKLNELFEGNEAIISGGCTGDIDSQKYIQSGGICAPLFRAIVTNPNTQPKDYVTFTICDYITHFDVAHPLLFDLKGSKTLNYFRIGKSYSAQTYTLWYSTDGVSYTSAATLVKTASVYEATFANITARYWKVTAATQDSSLLSISTSGNTPQVANLYKIATYPNSPIFNPLNQCALGYIGDPNITFTVAPAIGDVITMDCQLDRPMKNGNYVIDFEASLTY